MERGARSGVRIESSGGIDPLRIPGLSKFHAGD
jgi:hypothetical protein